jgi:phosphoribosyl-ATP pyrophosphohydrolase / phosphoribosyl-AMP cyclohydrolase / histidinol dehydrogenase
MTITPYPTLNQRRRPVEEHAAALAAVGRCRIDPSNDDPYRAIVDVNQNQAHALLEPSECSSNDNNNESIPSDVDRKQLSKKYMKQGVAIAREYLTQSWRLDVSIIDVEIVLHADDVCSTDGCLASCFLDAGCARIVVDGTRLDALTCMRVPADRVMAHFTTSTTPMDMSALGEYCTSVSLQVSSVTDLQSNDVTEWVQSIPDNIQVVVQVPLTTCSMSDSDVATAIATLHRTLNQRKGAGTVTLVDPTAEQLGMCYVQSCMRTDRPDGLFTTVVCTRAGEALGLVYSSTESIVASLVSGRGVYYSRSRGGLWRKGDTSGHYQILHRLDVDCDGDALRCMVTQCGDDTPAFCHLHTLTCWGPPHGLRHLQETLTQRLKDAPEGSYTHRLFQDSNLLRDKLVEEAQELAEADTKEHVAEELADLLYFAMVRAVQAGVSMDDAIAELDARTRKVTRRKGDSKEFRIAAGQAILEKKTTK